MKTTLLTLVLLLALAFGAAAQETPSEMTISISPNATDCVGEVPLLCLVVRELPDGEELTLFYDAIAGFEYQSGYEFQLRVAVSEVENPPADASSMSYELIEVLAQFPAKIENQVWELQSMGATVNENPSEFTLLFNEDGTVAITTDCNEIMLSEYSLNYMSITVGGMTRMFCEGSLEGQFINALGTLQLWSIENGELLMSSDEGLLRFAPANIDGKTWRVQSYESESLSWEDDGSADYTMLFDGETISLMIACNGGSGDIVRNGARITLGAVMSTLMGCMNDPLAGVFPPADFTYALDSEGRLLLNTADGKFVLVEVES